ncbi:E3 ubiquitin-protein ligase TRIM7-like [Sphaerodactylus townsendi]|nr:E3 ubiquitin-protein ligase TRIM7-like [Sphaerodactylus townsendi]
MAAAGALKQELCEEASCSVCLDFFRDPVTIAGCGHAFCRACLTHSWGDLQGAEASCPLCRGRAHEGTLRPNQQLANLVEIIQKLRPLEGSTKEQGGGGQKRKGGGLRAAPGAPEAFLPGGRGPPLPDLQQIPGTQRSPGDPSGGAWWREKAAMAAGGPVQELCEEASCSICLDFFRDPVMIPECGHTFCRACLTHSWGDLQGAEASCPQCRGPAKEGTLRPNYQLANFVEIIQKLHPQEEASQEMWADPLGVFSAGHSLHLPELDVILLQNAQAMVAGRKGRVCQKHQEPLKLFCKDDEALICVVCDRSKEHRDHKTVPLEEASQEYKTHFCSCLEMLKKERERVAACQADIEKESRDLLEKTTGEKQKMVAKFRQLHSFLEEREKLLLVQTEKVEETIARNRDQELAKISEELSSLESLIREMEEKCQLPAGQFLQDARSTLKRYEEKEAFKNPAAFPLALKWSIRSISDLNSLLKGIMKQCKDALNFGLHMQKANVTLDPNTAHPKLILSENWKRVRRGEKDQALPDIPERFEMYGVVLGCEGFTEGRYFWEVLVGSEERWALGVARKSVERKMEVTFSPENGIFAVGKWLGRYGAFIKGYYPPLTLSGELRRIRVFLNYAGGRVAFFDADRAALLFQFSGASFHGETLLPFFWVYEKGSFKLYS